VGAEQFEIAFPDTALTDLRDRLARTRWPATPTAAGWDEGTSVPAMQELALAWHDDDGFFYYAGRKKESMRRRGENVSAWEIENVVNQFPGVLESAAHAVPSELGEDDVKVTCVLQSDSDISAEELCRWAAERVPYFAIPRYIEFRGDLPRNPVGRVLKYELRAQGVTAQTWDREAAGVTFERR